MSVDEQHAHDSKKIGRAFQNFLSSNRIIGILWVRPHHNDTSRDEDGYDPNMPYDQAFNTLFKACPNISEIKINHKDTFRRSVCYTNERFLKAFCIQHYTNLDVVDNVITGALSAAYDAGLVIRSLAISSTWRSILLLVSQRDFANISRS
ncbi:hypothetical protein Slin15195_G062530 [Septoria linicola]|uniref:Uncharacterized protein n=1 Tax=Septoria linicola TaxID=215465 RepID=A0A9Q9EK66_9PEZI|nr:hypothetical protein Slin14017_G112860 [Septoria linicola]USW52934.1 hypothetical protein Slin15195_G062530 [Septoria linicola]